MTDPRTDPRGIYITSRDGDIITGHYVAMTRRGWTVYPFTACTEAYVLEVAGEVIHDPQIYEVDRVAPTVLGEG